MGHGLRRWPHHRSNDIFDGCPACPRRLTELAEPVEVRALDVTSTPPLFTLALLAFTREWQAHGGRQIIVENISVDLLVCMEHEEELPRGPEQAEKRDDRKMDEVPEGGMHLHRRIHA